MISDAADYRFVTFAPGIAVDGDIMPKRTDRSVLRGLDAGFLLEAYAERYRAVAGGVLAYVVNGMLAGLSAAARGVRTLISYPLSSSSGRFVADVQLSDRTASSADPVSDFGMEFPAQRLRSSAGDFDRSCRLESDAVMRLYSDMQALRTFVLAGDALGSWRTWTLSTLGDASAVSGTSDGPGTGIIHLWRSVYGRSGLATGIKNAAYGNLLFSVRDASLVGTCRILLYVTVTRDPPTLMGSESRSCWIVVPASRSDDHFVVPASILYEAASSAIVTTGLSRPPPPTSASQVNTSRLQVSVAAVFAVCTLTDHTNQE